MKIEDLTPKLHRFDIVSDIMRYVFRFWSFLDCLVEYDTFNRDEELTYEKEQCERLLHIVRIVVADYDSLNEDDRAYLNNSWSINAVEDLVDEDRDYLRNRYDEMTKAWNEYLDKSKVNV